MRATVRARPLLRAVLAARLVCLLLLVLGMSIPDARADDYFRVSPGPLSVGHAVYDQSNQCVVCHVSAEGVTNAKCLSCHPGLNHPGGLHASFGGKPCIECHSEHKGRDRTLVSWSTVGGRDAFDHARTGFPLQHAHAELACTRCHTRRLKSGDTAHLGLSRSCQSCHRGAHGFTDAKLANDCSTCHEPGESLRGRKLSAWLQPHERTSGVTFEGKHRDLACTKCHVGAKMDGPSPPRSCVNCHNPPHPVVGVTQRCTDCHSQKAAFSKATIDHDEQGFALTGSHAKVPCARCHEGPKTQRPRPGVTRRCVDCHTPSHPVTRATAKCTQCHTPGRSFRTATIQHEKFAFPLRGRHQAISCARCHRTRQKDIDYVEGACTRCHTHARAHNGQFEDKPCATCHVEGGKRTKPFDHNVDSRFPLRGFHADLASRTGCAKCHPDKVYRTGKIACRDCHEDPHHGAYGSDCGQCHSPLARFDSPRTYRLDHSVFPLEGKHRVIRCQDCHTTKDRKLTGARCITCHADDDVHHGKLGTDCGRCHRPVKGAPKFRHDTMTDFALVGAHRRASCALCHRRGASAANPLTLAEWEALPPPELDREFPSPGQRCQDCHADAHRGAARDGCAVCHRPTTFDALNGPQARAILPASHRGAWLRRHVDLPSSPTELGGERQNCSVCHGTPACRNCHRSERPRSHSGLWRMRTHGSAASFDVTSCRTCHQTASCSECHRRVRPLNHRGAWSTLHGFAAGGFGPSNCSVCHRRADCLFCHTAR